MKSRKSPLGKKKRPKIDVYLNLEQKKDIRKRADALGLSMSDFMKLKAHVLQERFEVPPNAQEPS